MSEQQSGDSLPMNSDPNLLVEWNKNGDHPEDNCDVFTDGPFKGSLKEGNVVRYFRLPGSDGDAVCPLCNKTYDEHGYIERRTHNALDSTVGPAYPGMVCPGDFILKTVRTPGSERYAVKRVSDITAAPGYRVASAEEAAALKAHTETGAEYVEGLITGVTIEKKTDSA